ncbi:hypothetical protein [Paenibacillus albidus]|uniref:hypothetical protein n=1 Tax=Paenibacillus albidus TaxID=2041023 RepID=UPI001667A770|nr:hypothetical protein [Paenibacillus albidus]
MAIVEDISRLESFLHSLSTEKVYLRSALSSGALISCLPVYTYGQRSSVRPAGDDGYSREALEFYFGAFL